MSKRRRNQEEAKSNKVAFILGALGAGAGLGVGYWIATTKSARDAADKLTQGWRIPQPDFRVHVPEEPNDFQRLDDEICDCAEPILAEVAEDADFSVVIDEIRLCVARRLYPDLEWPPVPGDHPSVAQLWSEVGFMVRRAIITDMVCDSPIAPPHPIPIPEAT
jgi:hypothetical protein